MVQTDGRPRIPHSSFPISRLRVLYFSQYFPPEVGATQTRAWEMARYLASRGHRVTVITEIPNHPSGIIPPEYRGRLSERKTEQGVDVLRLWVAASPEKSFRTRMQFYLSYMAMAGVAGALVKGHYDMVYATSPPLFVGAAGLFAALARRIPFVFEVRDLWPESAVALGELNSKRAISAAEKYERVLYRRARRVVAVTEGIRNSLLERGVPASRLAFIPNGANTDLFRFDPEDREAVRRRLGVEGKFLVMYAGIHGIAQRLETLLQAADSLRARDDIALVFVGEGPRKGELQRLNEQMDLPNVRFLPEVPSRDMPSYLSAADCTIVPLRDEAVFRGALPSKMFEAWACSRPVILSVAGEAGRVMQEAGGGIAIPPEDAASLASSIEYLAEHPQLAREMGGRGREYVAAHYSRREQARKLEELLQAVRENK